MVLYAKDSPNSYNVYEWASTPGSVDAYNQGAGWRYSTDKNASTTPSEIPNTDFAFRIYLQANLTLTEIQKLKVNNLVPTGPDANGAYYYNFTTPTYSAGTWPFTVANQNSGFDVIGLNFSATTYYRQYVRDVKIDVAADGTWDRTFTGTFDQVVVVTDLLSVFRAALVDAAPFDDIYNNPMCSIAVNFTAQGFGNLTVSALKIDYTCTVSTANFAPAMTTYLAGQPDGPVSVPVEVTATSGGRIKLSNLLVLVDEAPVLVGNIPNQVLLEETPKSDFANVSNYFSDEDNATVTFAIATNTNASQIEVTLNGTMLSARPLLVNWSGQTDVVIQATDSRGQKTLSNTFSIIVREVNDAPVITSTPPERAEALKTILYQVEAFDSEGDALTYRLEGPLPGMAINQTGVFNWTPPKSLIGQKVNVSINVSDGKLGTTQKFALQIYTNNTSPAITQTFNTSAYAGRPYYCQVLAHDAESDKLTYSLDQPPAGMTINSTTGLIYWPNPQSSANITVNVTDGIFWTTTTYQLTVIKNTPPKITSTGPTKIVWGTELSYQVTVSNPETAQTLTFTLITPPDDMRISANGLVTWTPEQNQMGSHHIRILVSDGFDNTTQSFDLEVLDKPLIPGTDNRLLYTVLFVLIVAAVLAGGYLYIRKRRRDNLMKQRWPVMPGKADGHSPSITPLPPETGDKAREAVSWKPAEAATAATAAAPAAGLPAVPAPPATPSESRVQDIFIIYRDGRLIHHLTNRLTALDHEIFASMFSSVQDFMKDSMGAERIDSIKYEEYNIILEKGKNISLAVVLTGEEPPDIRQVIKTAIQDVELVCARLLEKWDGDSAPLRKDLELLLKPISEAVAVSKVEKKSKTKNPEEYVSILSGVEFFRGYVKVKFAISNDLDNVITDANVKIIVKQDSLRIGWVEPPEYVLQGDQIVIGNAQPGEKIQFNLFLDPLVCSASFVDATLTFKDAKGDLYSIVMSRRKADVVCPTFHTDQDVNVAMLRKMITEFAQHDTKVYTLPEGLWAEEAFKMGMSVIEGHNVKLVREFTETTPVYSAEGWYYGKTQIKKDEVVMRISVSREHNSLEFFVGSSDQAVIAGLLAEFGHELNRRLKNKGLIQKDIKHLDLTDKDRIARKSQLLLHRYAESEAGAAENEPKK
jgi:hypothetical protein